ncbi:hypothetical protein F4679DRAFT_552888 [Xylaria curta]|nr:hypothetical protein F4679DRAFT_552888 [Xylaria curta]
MRPYRTISMLSTSLYLHHGLACYSTHADTKEKAKSSEAKNKAQHPLLYLATTINLLILFHKQSRPQLINKVSIRNTQCFYY